MLPSAWMLKNNLDLDSKLVSNSLSLSACVVKFRHLYIYSHLFLFRAKPQIDSVLLLQIAQHTCSHLCDCSCSFLIKYVTSNFFIFTFETMLSMLSDVAVSVYFSYITWLAFIKALSLADVCLGRMVLKSGCSKFRLADKMAGLKLLLLCSWSLKHLHTEHFSIAMYSWLNFLKNNHLAVQNTFPFSTIHSQLSSLYVHILSRYFVWTNIPL